MENQDNSNNRQGQQMSIYGALQRTSPQTVVSLSERYKEVTTIAQAFQLQEKPLAKAEGNVRGSIILHLGALARFLNLKATLTDEHIEFIADKILSDAYYKWLKPADLKLFFDRIKTGKYGDFYGNLNSISFFQSLDKYMIERNGEIERVRVQEQKERAEDLKQAGNLSYFINKDGKIEYTPAKLAAMERERKQQEAIAAETRRKQSISQHFNND